MTLSCPKSWALGDGVTAGPLDADHIKKLRCWRYRRHSGTVLELWASLMLIDLEMTWALLVILVSIRFGVVFFASPFDALGRLPARIRVLATLGLSATLVSALGLTAIELPSSLLTFGLLAASEALVGLMLAFGFYAAFGSIMVAGKLLDFQAGFGAAQILNPTTNAANPLFGTVLALFAVVIFFTSDAYMVAIRGLSWSLQALPPGAGVVPDALGNIASQFGVTYLYGIIIAAPVIGALLLLIPLLFWAVPCRR